MKHVLMVGLVVVLAGCAGPADKPTAGGSTPAATASAAAATQSAAGSTAAPAALGDELFLSAGDLGSGWKTVDLSGGSGDGSFAAALSLADCQAPGVAAVARKERGFDRGTSRSLTQIVERFTGDGATRFMAEVRARIAACRPATGWSVVINAQRFAGQDALLVEVHNSSQDNRYVFVRQGELVTEIGMNKVEETDYTVKDASAKAAQRLCAGTTAC